MVCIGPVQKCFRGLNVVHALEAQHEGRIEKLPWNTTSEGYFCIGNFLCLAIAHST